MSEVETALLGALRDLQHPGTSIGRPKCGRQMPSFMDPECIITAMPAEVHYDGGSEADRKRKLGRF
jgi:hypothetical protein